MADEQRWQGGTWSRAVIQQQVAIFLQSVEASATQRGDAHTQHAKSTGA